MLRRLLLYLSTADWARNIATHWGLARRVVRRFVAGETLDDALKVARVLNARGLLVSLDYLGESIHKAEDTQNVVQMYQRAIQQLPPDNSVSLKLTHLGLDIGEDLCVTNLRHILTAATARNMLVSIDMESSAHTDATLRIYRTLRDEYSFTNVGAVIQAYLYRSEEDMRQLASEGAHVRLCKGAYLEPPEVAFPSKADVNANFVKLTDLYLRADSSAYLCIATHDEDMIRARSGSQRAQHRARTIRVPDALRHSLAEAGRTGEGRLQSANLCPVWRGVVSVFHAPPGRAPRESVVLRAQRLPALRALTLNSRPQLLAVSTIVKDCYDSLKIREQMQLGGFDLRHNGYGNCSQPGRRTYESQGAHHPACNQRTPARSLSILWQLQRIHLCRGTTAGGKKWRKPPVFPGDDAMALRQLRNDASRTRPRILNTRPVTCP
jgi:proline dehydrogenase